MKTTFLVIFSTFFTFITFFMSFVQAQDAPVPWRIAARDDIAQVWSGNPVGFAFLLENDALYIAFYSADDRSMTLGKRDLSVTPPRWEFKKMPTATGWDSHHYIAMTFDADHILHVSGNMHGCPLIYFRAEKPWDIQSVQVVNRMVAESCEKDSLVAARENQVTYPTFMRTREGRLVYTYRDGGSGNGSQIWNSYDEKTRTWSRFLDTPMFDGEGECNAYFQGPKLGPDGWYHVAWVWRDTPDCATNHDLSYMCSRDLIHWEQSDGTPQILPVTQSNSEVVAPLKNGEGLLNPLVSIGFDPENRVVISYTRYDENQNNQLMQARREADGWHYYQTSDWTHSWVFSGGGCIPTDLSFSPVSVSDRGEFIQFWRRKDEKSGEFVLDVNTLKPVRAAARKSPIPGECFACENPQENQVQKRFTLLDPQNPDRMFLFVWETLPVNRDRPHPVVPNPSMLRGFELVR